MWRLSKTSRGCPPISPTKPRIRKRAKRSTARPTSETGTRFCSGRAFDADAKEADTFAKLARYETRLERSLHRSLNELRQLQARRQNRPASPISDAVTLDVNRYPLSKLSSGRGVPEGAEPKRIPILALSAAFVPSPRSRRPVRGSQFHFCETNPIDH